MSILNNPTSVKPRAACFIDRDGDPVWHVRYPNYPYANTFSGSLDQGLVDAAKRRHEIAQSDHNRAYRPEYLLSV